MFEGGNSEEQGYVLTDVIVLKRKVYLGKSRKVISKIC